MIGTMREFYTRGMLKAFPQLQRRLDMAQAYQRVLVGGNASPAECRLVLRDQIRRAGLLAVDTELTGADALYRAGRRSIVAETLQILRWSESELLQLGQDMTFEEVAAHEAQRELDGAR